MKKLQALLLILTVSSLSLYGCGSEAEDEVVASVTVDVAEEEEVEETIVEEVEEVDLDVAPDDGMVRSTLTNEWIYEEVAALRPIAVMTPNESSAIPHSGLSEASILYECNVEGNMTRMMAVYEDYEDLDQIGNIRSLRDYYAYWAFEWDAVICHFGGPYYIDDIVAAANTDNLNGNILSDPFFRSSDRSAPHNAYLDGSIVVEAMEDQGISTSVREDLVDDYHYLFTTKSDPNTLTQYTSVESATYIDMTGCYPLTRAYFEYNEEDGLYYRSQYVSGGTDGPHIDGSNGEQLTFTNIIIQANDYAVRDASGYLWYATVDTTGRDAWYITQGQIIKCTWEKDSEFASTRYYDENGDEITLNTGKTMLMIIQDGDMFDYE
ncbi:MAG: DUF3048 domain-containing protein [Lachnospiraceae bacterium]